MQQPKSTSMSPKHDNHMQVKAFCLLCTITHQHCRCSPKLSTAELMLSVLRRNLTKIPGSVTATAVPFYIGFGACLYRSIACCQRLDAQTLSAYLQRSLRSHLHCKDHLSSHFCHHVTQSLEQAVAEALNGFKSRLAMVPDDAPTVTSNTSKVVVGNGNLVVRKQPKLKRSSGSATNIARPSGPRKLSNAEYGAAKGQAGFASSTMRRSLSQDFTSESSLQRPSKPLQVPVQLPLQLPATKVHLAAVGTRKWLKIEASGATSVLQVGKSQPKFYYCKFYCAKL